MAQLVQLNGGPVRFDGVSVGWRSITIHNVQLFEPDVTEPTIWCSFNRLWMNLSFWDALWGKTTAERAILFEPVVRLRFAADGKLLNQFRRPKGGIESPAKYVEIRNATVTAQQAQRPEFVLRKIDVIVQQDESQLLLEGNIDELLGGTWLLSGSIDIQTFDVTAKLTTDDVRVEADEIVSLPVVGFDIRPYGQFAARGRVEVDVGWITKKLNYNATLVPTTVRASLPKLQIATTITSGKLAVNNDHINLSNLHATLFGGQYRLSGNVDLTHQRGNMLFRFNDLASSDLPEKWPVPASIDATLDGEGQFEVQQVDDSWKVTGMSEVHVRDVLNSEANHEPITLNFELDSRIVRNANRPLGVDGTADVHVVVRNLEAGQIDFEPLKDLDGTLSFDGDFQLPLASEDWLKAIGGKGRLESPSLNLRGVEIRDMSARMSLEMGALTFSTETHLRDSEGNEAGQVVGNGKLNVYTLKDVHLSAELRDVSLPMMLAAIGTKDNVVPVGRFNTSLTATVPLDGLDDLAAWRIDGRLTSQILRFVEHDVHGTLFEYDLANARLRLTNGRTNCLGAHANYDGNIELKAPYDFELHGTVNGANLTSLATRLSRFPDVKGIASGSGNVKGSFKPLKWSGHGNGSVRAVELANVDLGSPTFEWKVDQNGASVADLRTDLFGGSAKAEARYAFAEDSASSLNASLTDIDLAMASAVLKDLKTKPNKLSGRFSADVSVNGWASPEQATGKVSFRANTITGSKVEFRRVEGQLELAQQSLTLDASADMIGGSVRIAGNSSIAALGRTTEQSKQPPLDRFQGDIQLQRFPIQRILKMTGHDRMLKSLSGSVAAQLKVRLDSNWNPHASGPLSLRSIQWLTESWSREIRGSMALTGNSLRLEQFNGDLAGGRVRGNCDLLVGGKVAGTFRMALEGVQASQILLPIPDVAANVQGPMDVRIQGTIGDQWTGQAQLSMSRANILSLPVSRLRAPVNWSFSPARPQLRLRTSNAVARMARGQIAGGLELSWANLLALDARVRAKNVELRSLFRDVPGIGSVGAGRISGEARIGGRRIESVNDLSGRFQADLSQLQPLQIPVLRHISPFVAGIGPTTSFHTGRAKGRLANGIVHLDPTTIDGGVARIMVEGKTTLRGRLDLDVMVKTGELAGASAEVTRLLRSPIARAASSPLSLLNEANEFLSDRLVYLHVGGTVKRPVVRPQPAQQLQQEAIRFFLPGAVNTLRDNQAP